MEARTLDFGMKSARRKKKMKKDESVIRLPLLG
jgi:hypothetical protein